MTDEHATDPLAPLEAKARALRAQKDAAHRNTVLHEAAAAIQDFIDRDRARSAVRSNDRAALGAARQIVLGLIDGPAATIPTPAPADRAAVLREAADDLATAFGDPMVKHIGITAASHLRRRAREADTASGSGQEDGKPQQDGKQAAAGVRFFTIVEDQAHSSEPEGYDSSGCPCNPADAQYTLEIDEGGCALIHTACGKQPPSHWGDWTDLLVMQPVPVTAKWIPNCDGSEWHGDHRCDCGSTLQISPADPATLAAIALTDIARQSKPDPADAVRDQPAADTSWTILTHRNGTWTPWLGERHTAAEAREDFNTTVAVHGTKWAFRLVRHDTTHTVEAEHQPDKEA
ncbi:hypothetical protein AB0454_22485 [Streptomyces sp. NPDC093509]|uniref:hypothetical protein n=1 Tax=Streptomyces sp. NPDC093509 TaxID=3154982 RepID=UPI00344F78F7